MSDSSLAEFVAFAEGLAEGKIPRAGASQMPEVAVKRDANPVTEANRHCEVPARLAEGASALKPKRHQKRERT